MKYKTPLERVKANVRVDAETGCWIWQGKTVTNSRGEKYGRINVRERGQVVSMLVHRFVLKFVLRKNIDGRVGGHKCDVSLCCNPKHLESITQSRNMLDCVKRGRHGSVRTA